MVVVSVELVVEKAENGQLRGLKALGVQIDKGTTSTEAIDAAIREAYRLLIEENDRQALKRAARLTGWPKSSGSKGMQLYVPVRETSAERTSSYAKDLAQRLEASHPDLVVSRMTKTLREGKVLIDWSQNSRHKTTVCAYSLRARPHPTVSTPVTWDEVEACRSPEDLVFTAPDVLDRVQQLAPSEATILIVGETGTGKDLLARAVHAESGRARGPFIVVDCGAVVGNLIESELFGHEKGAFTGADNLRRGRFEQADGGTLFLDEIGDMPLDLQARLLRVLDERQVTPLGTEDTYAVDFQLISASHHSA